MFYVLLTTFNSSACIFSIMPPCTTNKSSRPYWWVATTLAVGLLQMNMVTFLSFKVSTVDLQERFDVVLTRPNAVLIRGLKLQKRMQRSRRKAFLKHVAFGVNASQYYVESEWGRHWRSDPFGVFSHRKAAGNSTAASYASFGPNHQYYVEFSDWIYWKIDDAEIERLAKENNVKFVSFGPQGAVVLVLKSGAYYFRDLALIGQWGTPPDRLSYDWESRKCPEQIGTACISVQKKSSFQMLSVLQ